MIGNLSRLDTLRLPGETYDNARCFEAKDLHSECMETFKHLKGIAVFPKGLYSFER